MILNLQIGDYYEAPGYNRRLEITAVDKRSDAPGDIVYSAVDENGDGWAVVDGLAVLVKTAPSRLASASVLDSMGGAVG